MKSTLNNKQRILALLLSVAMLAALLPVSVVPVFAAGGTWEGDGLTEETAYQISDAADLAKLAENTNNGESYQGKYFKLTGDIDLTEWLNASGDSNGWTSIGNSNAPFSGTLDGQGHTISGLWLYRTSNEYQGLFGYMSGGTLKNLSVKISDKQVQGRRYTGGLCGFAYTTGIENCHVNGTVTNAREYGGILVGRERNCEIINCSTGGKIVATMGFSSDSGGLVGNSGGHITSCWSDAYVEGQESAGGLVGTVEGGVISDCYAVGDVSGRTEVGGLVGNNWSGEVYNSYALGNVTGTTSAGALIGENYKTYVNIKDVNGNYFSMGQTVNGNPADENSGVGNGVYLSKVVGKTTDELKQQATFADWDFDNTWSIIEGETYPYLKNNLKTIVITTVEELAEFRDRVNSGSKFTEYIVSLANDIDLTEYLAGAGNNNGAGWKPIGNLYNYFSGLFDGGGHTISGLWINSSDVSYIGLFGSTNGTIQNLRVKTSPSGISSSGIGYDQGILIGFLHGGTVRNCFTSGSIYGNLTVGGLIGNMAYSIVEGCGFEGTVNGKQESGGIIGQANGDVTVRNCYVLGSVTAREYIAGGLIGWQAGGVNVENSYTSADVSAPSELGGITGRSSGYFSGCYWDRDRKQTENGTERGNDDKLGLGSNSSTTSVTGKSSAELKQQATFVGWDFENIWGITEGILYPYLKKSPNYVISTAEELAAFSDEVNNGNSYSGRMVSLANDIDLTEYLAGAGNNNGAGWKPIGIHDNNFSGLFDGGGHTISGLWINSSDVSYIGLFGSTNGTIQNLRVKTSPSGISSSGIGYDQGILTGHMERGTVRNCFVSGSISANTKVGGFIGSSINSIVEGCGFEGTINGKSSVGGLFGEASGSGTVRNCYVLGSVTASENIAGGLIGWQSVVSSAENCYASADVSAASGLGGIIGTTSGNLSGCFWDTERKQRENGTLRKQDEKLGVGSNASASGVTGKSPAELRRLATFEGWDFENIWNMTDDASYPYLKNYPTGIVISTAEELAALRDEVNNGNSFRGRVVSLANDIDLTEYLAGAGNNGGKGWLTIGMDAGNSFNGCFDGGGHTVSGLWSKNSSKYYAGLFGQVNGIVQNLQVKTSLAGIIGNNTGVLIGTLYGGVLRNCFASGSVSGDEAIGGLAGDTYNNEGMSFIVENCGFEGAVQGNKTIGGVIGNMNGSGTLRNCYMTGTVTGTAGAVGGLVGWSGIDAVTENCYASADVSGTTDIGGFVGSGRGPFSNCYWDTERSQTVYGVQRQDSEKIGVGSNAYAAGVTGKSPAELKQQSTFTDWDFENVWNIVDGATYPYLKNSPDLLIINTAEELAAFGLEVNRGNTFEGRIVNLANDIDLTEYLSGAGNNGGKGWISIGDNGATFSGIFDGGGHTISGLWNNENIGPQGLFGTVSGTIQNLRVETSSVGIIGNSAGIMVESLYGGVLRNCFVSGKISGNFTVGGLVSSAKNRDDIKFTVENCAFEGSVNGATQVGGLIGSSSGDGVVRNCYASGTVTASGGNIGGLIGWKGGAVPVENCYASVDVSGPSNIGGLTGTGIGSFVSCFWDTERSQTESGTERVQDEKLGVGSDVSASGVTGKSPAELKQQATFEGWDFENIWKIKEGTSYPFLSRFTPPDFYLNGTAGNWENGNTITIDQNGGTLEIVSAVGPSTPVKISVTPPSDSEVSITGRSGVNYENLYIEAEGDNLVLKLADLEITPPKDKNNPDKDKNAVCFTGDSSHTISVSGECSMHSESDSYFNAGAVRDVSGSLTITGGVLNASYSGDGSGNAVYAGKDLNIETEVNVLSDYNGINAGGNIFVDGGKVTARGVNGTKSSSGLYSMGNIYIQNGGTVISEPAAHVGVYYGINASKGVIVSDTSKVNVNGGNGGVAILVNNGDFKVSGNAEVTAAGGDSNINGGGNGIVVWTGVAEISDNAVVKTNGGINTTEQQDISVGGDGMTLCDSASLILNGGTLEAVGGSSELGSGGNGIYITAKGVTVHNGQLTAGGGRGVYGGRGIYSQLEMQIEAGTVNVSGGVSQESANGSIGAGLRASGLTVSGGSLTAAGGDGKQSDEDINAHDFAGPGIYTWNDITVNGGSVKAYGAKGILGGYGVMTAYGSVSVSGGADFEVIGGTGTQNNGGVAMYVDFNDFKTPFTVDNSAGNVYIRGGQSENANLDESPAVMATYSYIATGNIGMIEAVQGEIKNAPGGDDVYMVKADTSPPAPGALFESVVKTETAGLSPSYTYLSRSGADGIGYLWLPANQQIVSSENYGDGAVKVETDNDSKVTLYTGYNITVNYKEDTEVIESETPAAGLGETFNLTAPQGYALPDSVSPALTLDSSLLAGGTVGGCNVTVSGQNITVDVPVAPLEIALTVSYKTSGGETVGTQNLDKNYNVVITSGDLNLPTGYTLTGFNEFKLNSGTEGLTFDFTAVPKPTAEITVTVTAGGIEITAKFISGTEVGSCTFTKAYGDEITKEDLTLPVGYKLTDKFANILVTDTNITIQPGGKTGTVEIAAEPIQYTVNAVFKDGSEQVGTPFTVTKTIGQTVTAQELNVPAGYTLQNYTDIIIDEALILGASGETPTVITVDVAVAPLEIALTVNYITSAGETVGTQNLDKNYNSMITSGDLNPPTGYTLTGFNEFKLNSGTEGLTFDFTAVPKPTAEITVTVTAGGIEITAKFISGTEVGSCTFTKSYGDEITKEDLTLPVGYKLTDKFANILVTDTNITIQPGGKTGTVDIEAEPIQYTVNAVFKDGSEQVGTPFTVAKTIGQTVTAQELNVPAGYTLQNYTDIKIDEALILGASGETHTVITVDVAIAPLEIVLTVNYKTSSGETVGTQSINKYYNTIITSNDLLLPMGYALTGFEEFKLNIGTAGLTFDFNAVPKPTAEITVTAEAKEYEITVTFVSAAQAGTCTFKKAYGSEITEEDLTLPAGYRLTDKFTNIMVTDTDITIPPGGNTGTVEIAVEPIPYTVNVVFKDGSEQVGDVFAVASEKTIGQSVTAEELNVPAGYALQNFSGIEIDESLILEASENIITLDIAVEVQKIALTIYYKNQDEQIGSVQMLNKDATSVLTEDELSIPFGYHLESDWNDISMDDSESFDVYQVINASGTAEKTVQVRPNSVGVTVRFVQGTEDRGTQELSADYGTIVSAGDLNGMDAGYRLPDSFAEIAVNQSEQRLIFENDTSAVLTVQVIPAEYIVTVRYNDKNGTEYTMQQPVSYAGTITNITNVPEGYYLDSFSGILLDSGNSNVTFDHENRTALVNAAVLPYDYTVTINYFDGAVFVGREQIVSAYDSGITEFAPPAGYETADGVDIAVNQDLSPDHKYRTANVNLPVSKTAYSVQIIYSGGNGTQTIEGKKVGDSIRISELVWPEGFSLVNFTDIYIDSKLAAAAVNGVITLDVPVTLKGVVVTITYMAEGIPVGTQIRNEAGGTLITADMLSVPYGYEMGTFDSVTAVSDMSLEIEVTLLKAKNVTVIPGQIVLTLEKDKEGYASAIVSPANILGGSVSWESGNPAVAKVDEYGRIIPISKGSTVIKAVSNQTETAFGECMVTVLSLGDSYAEVLPYLTDWSNQSISAAINVHSDSGQTPGENIVKYKVTESASEQSYIDDGSWTDYTGPVSVSEDGIHYIHWYVQDLNGKSSQGVSNAYKIDTAPPEIINARAAAKSKSQIDLTAEAADSGSGLRGYAWYLTADGSETLLSTNKAFSHTGLKAGTDYTYKLVVTDMAGNRSEQTCTAKTDKNSGSGSSGGGGGTSVYTVTFDSRGGSEIDSVRVAWNGKITKPADPVREGYTFGGWFTDDECTKSYDFDSKITASFTLYAKWNENSQPPETWDNPFTDVKESDWFYGNVKYVYENKLFVGVSDTLFAPNDNMTRAMLVQVLYRAEGEPSMENENWGYPFEDVDAGSWYGTAVYWARANGIVKGDSDLEFAPDRLITREEIAAIMYRYAALKGTAAEKKGDLSKFTDEALISGWARESMEWAVGCGLIMGKDNGIIDPLAGATRAEVAAILQRFIEMK